MATFDFTPFYHATVGFDRISSLLADALERDETAFRPTTSRRQATTLTAS